MSDNLHEALKYYADTLESTISNLTRNAKSGVFTVTAAALATCHQSIKEILAKCPEPETTTEWGTRKVVDGEVTAVYRYENEAEARHFADCEDEELVTRQVGPWQKASEQ